MTEHEFYKQYKVFAFTTHYGGRPRSIVSEIGIRQSAKFKQTSIEKVKAIWDTGATNSVVSDRVAWKLGLVPVGKIRTSGVHGQSDVNEHLVDIFLPNHVAVEQVRVASARGISGDNSPIDMLIGMDIIGAGDFAITHDQNGTLLTYRIPAVPPASVNFLDGIDHFNSSVKKAEVEKKRIKLEKAYKSKKRNKKR